MLSRLSSTTANPNQVQPYSQEPAGQNHQMSRSTGTNSSSNLQSDQSQFAITLETDVDGNKSAKFGALISGNDVVAAAAKTGSLVKQGSRQVWSWLSKPKAPESASSQIPSMQKMSKTTEEQLDAYFENKIAKAIDEQVDVRFAVMKKENLKTQRITTGAQLGGGGGMLFGVWQGCAPLLSLGLGAGSALLFGSGAYGYDRMAKASSPETQQKLAYVDKAAQAIAPTVLAMGLIMVGGEMTGKSTAKQGVQAIKQAGVAVTVGTAGLYLQNSQDATSKERVAIPLKA